MNDPYKFRVGDMLYFPKVPEVDEKRRGRVGELVFIDHTTTSWRKYGVDFGKGYEGCSLLANDDNFSLQDATGAWFSLAELSYAVPALVGTSIVQETPRTKPPQPAQSGLKYDGGKPLAAIPYQDFPNAMTAVVDVATFGAAKYARSSWKSVPNAAQRYADAMHRHMLAQARGEFRDPESGLPHSAHIAWNALALAELELGSAQGTTYKESNVKELPTPHAEKNS